VGTNGTNYNFAIVNIGLFSGMTFGQIDIDIYSSSGEHCEAQKLDNLLSNDFQEGQIDIFEGLGLDGCFRNDYARSKRTWQILSKILHAQKSFQFH
jgi:hypothetical protein